MDEGINLLEKSIEMNNSNVYAYLALGDAYEKIENYKKAICVYRELASLG